MKKIATLMLSTALLLAGCASTTPPTDAPATPTDEETTTPPAPQLETYTSTQYGFTVVLPEGWTATDLENNMVAFNSAESAKSVAENAANCENPSPEKPCAPEAQGMPYKIAFSNTSGMKLEDFDASSVQKVTINNVEFTKYSVGGMIDSDHYEATIDGEIYRFLSYSSPDQIADFISTFAVIK